MSRKAREELTATVAARYRATKSRKEKTKILDEYCKNTGLHRKYAMTKLMGYRTVTVSMHRGRKPLYTKAADAKLLEIWRAFDYICAERLHPFLSEAISILKRCHQVQLSSSIEEELTRMSCSSVKRRIRGYRKRNGKHGLSGTRHGSLLKKDIPIQTSCWEEQRAGYGEIDLVQHCGDCAAGEFINTLQYVDIKTTWIERKAVMGKSQDRVFAAIQQIESQLPFQLKGIDSDNGSEFINAQLYRYCKDKDIAFTRSRPYKKNDNAHIEQKNWTCIRKILGYERFDTKEHLKLLNDLYDNELRLYTNFFQPSMKLVAKKRVGSRIKRVYDIAKTPYQRVLACPEVSDEAKRKLTAVYEQLDPVLLRETITKKIRKIVTLRLR